MISSGSMRTLKTSTTSGVGHAIVAKAKVGSVEKLVWIPLPHKETLFWPALLYADFESCTDALEASLSPEQWSEQQMPLMLVGMQYTMKQGKSSVARLLGPVCQLYLVEEETACTHLQQCFRHLTRQMNKRELFDSDEQFIDFHAGLDAQFIYSRASCNKSGYSHGDQTPQFKQKCYKFLDNDALSSMPQVRAPEQAKPQKEQRQQLHSPAASRQSIAAISVGGESYSSTPQTQPEDSSCCASVAAEPKQKSSSSVMSEISNIEQLAAAAPPSPSLPQPVPMSPLPAGSSIHDVFKKLTFLGGHQRRVGTMESGEPKFRYVPPSKNEVHYPSMTLQQLEHHCEQHYKWEKPKVSAQDQDESSARSEPQDDASTDNHSTSFAPSCESSSSASITSFSTSDKEALQTSSAIRKAVAAKRALKKEAAKKKTSSKIVVGHTKTRTIKKPSRMTYVPSTRKKGEREKAFEKPWDSPETNFYRFSVLYEQLLKPELGWNYITQSKLLPFVESETAKFQLRRHTIVYAPKRTHDVLKNADAETSLQLLEGEDFFIEVEDVIQYCRDNKFYEEYGDSFISESALTTTKPTIRKKAKAKNTTTQSDKIPRASAQGYSKGAGASISPSPEPAFEEASVTSAPSVAGETIASEFSQESETYFYNTSVINKRMKDAGWNVRRSPNPLETWWWVKPKFATMHTPDVKRKLRVGVDYFSNYDDAFACMKAMEDDDERIQRKLKNSRAQKRKGESKKGALSDPTIMGRKRRVQKLKNMASSLEPPTKRSKSSGADGIVCDPLTNRAPWVDYADRLQIASPFSLLKLVGVYYAGDKYRLPKDKEASQDAGFESCSEIFKYFLKHGIPNFHMLDEQDKIIMDLIVRHSHDPTNVYPDKKKTITLLTSDQAWQLLRRFKFTKASHASGHNIPIHASPESSLAKTTFRSLEHLRSHLRSVDDIRATCLGLAPASCRRGRRRAQQQSANEPGQMTDNEALALRLWLATSRAPLPKYGEEAEPPEIFDVANQDDEPDHHEEASDSVEESRSNKIGDYKSSRLNQQSSDLNSSASSDSTHLHTTHIRRPLNSIEEVDEGSKETTWEPFLHDSGAWKLLQKCGFKHLNSTYRLPGETPENEDLLRRFETLNELRQFINQRGIPLIKENDYLLPQSEKEELMRWIKYANISTALLPKGTYQPLSSERAMALLKKAGFQKDGLRIMMPFVKGSDDEIENIHYVIGESGAQAYIRMLENIEYLGMETEESTGGLKKRNSRAKNVTLNGEEKLALQLWAAEGDVPLPDFIMPSVEEKEDHEEDDDENDNPHAGNSNYTSESLTQDSMPSVEEMKGNNTNPQVGNFSYTSDSPTRDSIQLPVEGNICHNEEEGDANNNPQVGTFNYTSESQTQDMTSPAVKEKEGGEVEKDVNGNPHAGNFNCTSESPTQDEHGNPMAMIDSQLLEAETLTDELCIPGTPKAARISKSELMTTPQGDTNEPLFNALMEGVENNDAMCNEHFDHMMDAGLPLTQRPDDEADSYASYNDFVDSH